ncbi:MAG: hypothetical protein Kow00121_33610 [Elainellaceae cyanobacterium]
MLPAIPASAQSASAPAIASCKAAVFKVADYWFALPATAIRKVVPFSTLNRGTHEDSLLLWHDHPLVWLDLHLLLTPTSNNRPFAPQTLPAPQTHVLIVWSQTGDRCAIPVDKLPTLLEIPLSEAQVLPPHYRQTIGQMARYMVVRPFQGANVTILLLDLMQALQRRHY